MGMSIQTPSAAVVPAGFIASLLDATTSLREDARRFGVGLALSAVFGLALGLRFGPLAMAVHAVGVPAAFVAVAALGAPAVASGLLHTGLPVDGRAALAAIARGTATAGVVLAGLAPTLVLLAATCEAHASVAVAGAVGLGVGGAMGLAALLRRMPVGEANRTAPRLLACVFAAFAIVLAARVWWLALPLYRSAL